MGQVDGWGLLREIKGSGAERRSSKMHAVAVDEAAKCSVIERRTPREQIERWVGVVWVVVLGPAGYVTIETRIRRDWLIRVIGLGLSWP